MLEPTSATACSHLRHGFLRTELTVRPWPTRSEAQPGMPPPAIQAHLLQTQAQELQRRAPLAGPLILLETAQGLRNWTTRLLPGEAILAEVASGGLVTLRGAGEHITLRTPHPAWVRIFHPLEAATRAAAEACPDDIAIEIQQLAGHLWATRTQGAPLSVAPPQAVVPIAGAPASAPGISRPGPSLSAPQQVGLLAWLAAAGRATAPSAAQLPPEARAAAEGF